MGAGVCNGVEDPLTEAAKRAFYDFAAYLDKTLQRGHRDWKTTSCPGEPTYAWRRAGFPKPAGGPPPQPPKDWFDMATKAELQELLRTYTSGWLVRARMPDGKLDDNVFVVASDFSTKTWWGGWTNVRVIDFVDDLMPGGTDAAGNPKAWDAPWATIAQIHELENPVIGTSENPKPDWQERLAALNPQ
jgi:hypothetical protein